MDPEYPQLAEPGTSRHVRLTCMKDDTHKLALHTCCAPCLIEPLRLLSAEFADLIVVYYNPNITPEEEYRRRRDTFVSYAQLTYTPYGELDYDAQRWQEAMGTHLAVLDESGHDTAPESPARCRRCYELRFEPVIAWAAEHGSTHFATTLTVSPFQQRDVIDEAARRLCDEAGLTYAGRDFSAHYPDALRVARELGLYRQNYCGCTLRPSVESNTTTECKG